MSSQYTLSTNPHNTPTLSTLSFIDVYSNTLFTMHRSFNPPKAVLYNIYPMLFVAIIGYAVIGNTSSDIPLISDVLSHTSSYTLTPCPHLIYTYSHTHTFLHVPHLHTHIFSHASSFTHLLPHPLLHHPPLLRQVPFSPPD